MDKLQEILRESLDPSRQILAEAMDSVEQVEARSREWPTLIRQTRELVVPQHRQWLHQLDDLARGPSLAPLKREIERAKRYYENRWNHPAVVIARLRIAGLSIQAGMYYLQQSAAWLVRGFVFLIRTVHLAGRVGLFYVGKWSQEFARWLSRSMRGRQ